MHNEILSGESYKVSRVITPRGEKWLKEGKLKVVKSCEILPKENLQEAEIQNFLKLYKEEVLECLYSSGVELYDEATTKNLQSQSKTIFKIPPRRVLVMLKDGVVNLSVLEKK